MTTRDELDEQLAKLKGSVQRVRDLHVIRVEAADYGNGPGWRQLCRECRQAYPCPTIKALDDAE